MSNETSSWNAIMQYSFLRVFANDGTIDADEFAMLQKLALTDGEVDDRERKVLAGIFSRLNADTVEPGIWSDICRFKERYSIP